MSQWYLSYNGRQMGPMSLEQARLQCRADPSGHAWCGGFADWTPMARVPELSGSGPARPAVGLGRRFLRLHFSPEGRVGRRTYWLNNFVYPFAFYLLFVFAIGLQALRNPDPSPTTILPVFLLFLPATLFLTVSGIIISIKRCHDRGRSGLFLLWGLIPFVNIWLVFDLALFRGTRGPNEYGPDPLA